MDTVGATFESETEIYGTVTVTVNAIFATLATVRHFVATWTGIGVAANATSNLGNRLGWASVQGAHAHLRATFEIYGNLLAEILIWFACGGIPVTV